MVETVRKILVGINGLFAMSTREYIIRKNKIVFGVTSVVLVPEDQIVDEPRVRLVSSGYGLSALLCPYCQSRREEDGSIDCSTCIMVEKGNYCNDEDSSWTKASDLWEELSTQRDRDKLSDLIKAYNDGGIEGRLCFLWA